MELWIKKIGIFVGILMLLVIPIISAGEFNPENPIFSTLLDNKVQAEDSNVLMKFSNNHNCKYRFCEGTAYFELRKNVYSCVDIKDINFPTEFGYNHNIIWDIDDSYTTDGTIYECHGEVSYDDLMEEEIIIYPDRLWTFEPIGDELPPKWYNEKLTYCINTTRIYSQEYLDYQNGKLCVSESKEINYHFIAPKGSSGKFDIVIDWFFETADKVVRFFIDPTWTTGNSNWENGTFNYTEEAVTGELQINNSIEYPNNQGIDWHRNMTGNVLLLHLNNDSSVGENATHAYDYSGSGNNGTLVDVDWDETTYKLGTASIDFSGTNGDYINISNESQFDFTTEFTTSQWIYPDVDSASSQNIISKWYDGSNRAWSTYINSDEQFVFITSDAGSDTDTLTSTGTLSVASWNHVVTTFDNGVKTIYINGVASGSNTGGSPLYNNAEQVIIGCNYITETCLNGKLDEVAIYNRSLSADEILNLYSAQQGYYESEIFNAGSSVNWTNITWIQDSAYNLAELPNNQGTDTENYILTSANMTGNILLIQDNENDTSGNGITGTFEGGGEFNSDNVKLGSKSFSCDANNAINYGNEATLDFGSNEDFSSCVWVYSEELSTTYGKEQHIWVKREFSGGYTGIQLRLKRDNNKVFFVLDGAGGNGGATSNTVVAGNDEWTHICVTVDRSDTSAGAKLYINGVLDDTGSGCPYNLDNSENFYVGTALTGTYDMGLVGEIDELAFWNRTLSADEIEDLFLRGAGQFNISVRSCDDSLCDTETWNATYTEPNYTLDVADNQYFQYRIDLSRNAYATLFSPEFWNVSVGYETTITDTCTYGGSGDWEISMEDYCNISINYNVSGLINFTGSYGECTIDSQINVTDMVYPPSNTTLWINSSADIKVY